MRLTTAPEWVGIEPVLTGRARGLQPGEGFLVTRTVDWRGRGKPGSTYNVCSQVPRTMRSLLEGLIEAFRVKSAPSFALAVQWHPELMPHSRVQRGLFTALVRAARTISTHSRRSFSVDR